jgi:hypothetical protein
MTGKSAATGRPHYFGRLYDDTGACLWCGNPPAHSWHFTERGAETPTTKEG